jgi:hypothetical protein
MIIESCKFGSMVVDGTAYTKDLIILPDRVISPWWRVDGHSLAPGDLKVIFDLKPEIFVVGTGAMGMMRVPDETLKVLTESGIDTIIMRTPEAYTAFNKISPSINACSAFHLTC